MLFKKKHSQWPSVQSQLFSLNVEPNSLWSSKCLCVSLCVRGFNTEKNESPSVLAAKCSNAICPIYSI